MAYTLETGNIICERGEKVSGLVPVEGTDIKIPVTLICGVREGKTALVTGGIHSAEFVGIETAIELADETEPKDIAGNLIIISVVNTSGFEHRTMSMVYEDGKNLNRVFPGNPEGTAADRLAWAVEKFFLKAADYYIDLHCGDGYEDLIPYVYFSGTAEKEVARVSEEMASHVKGLYKVAGAESSGEAYNYANVCGIPAILIERGRMGA